MNYVGVDKSEIDDKMMTLLQLGFTDIGKNVDSLKRTRYDVNEAAAYLILQAESNPRVIPTPRPPSTESLSIHDQPESNLTGLPFPPSAESLAIPNQDWPFFAKIVFDQMAIEPQIGLAEVKDEDMTGISLRTVVKRNSSAQDLMFANVPHRWTTPEALNPNPSYLDHKPRAPRPLTLVSPPPLSPASPWKKEDSEVKVSDDWATASDLGYLTEPASFTVSSSTKECPICCTEYEENCHAVWSILTCSHTLCTTCHERIETTRTSMSGATQTSIRCPFCQGISGIEVGTCPSGVMKVDEIPTSCSGYEEYNSIRITYVVSDSGYRLHRAAYLPNNEGGQAVLELLKEAWDRRLCFTIGTSATTGVSNVLVWNIHHKTTLNGGVWRHGYPDPGYLERVRWELKAYGIE